MWGADTCEEMARVVCLVQLQHCDVVLVSSCGARLGVQGLLLALHSPLLATLLQHGDREAGVSLPLPLSAIRGLLAYMLGQAGPEQEEEVGEAAHLMGMSWTNQVTQKISQNTLKTNCSPTLLNPTKMGGLTLDKPDLQMRTKKESDLNNKSDFVIKSLKIEEKLEEQQQSDLKVDCLVYNQEKIQDIYELYDRIENTSNNDLEEGQIESIKNLQDEVQKIFFSNFENNLKPNINIEKYVKKLKKNRKQQREDGERPRRTYYDTTIEKGNFLCPDCGETFQTSQDNFKRQLKDHQFKHDVSEFTCDCPDFDMPKVVIWPYQLRVGPHFRIKLRHMRTVHQDWLQCFHCGKCFATKDLMTKHEEKSHLVCNCDACDFTTNDIFKLRNHKTASHGKPTSCLECFQTFSSKVLMKNHMNKVHVMHTCPICSAKVKIKLNLHMRRMHSKDDEKAFRCTICEKGFIDNGLLEAHKMNVHIKSRPYNCRYGCEDKRYNDLGNRNSHEKKRHGGLFETQINNK